MKLVAVTQWGRARGAGLTSHPPDASPAGRERTRRQRRQGVGAAGGRGDAGRVIEPRNVSRRGHQESPPSHGEGESRRCPGAGRPQSWTREGECGGHPRGRSAGQAFTGVTRARGRATTLLGNGPDRGAGRENLRAQRGGVVLGPGGACSRGSPQGIGGRGTTEGRRAGVGAVVAEQSPEGLRARGSADREGGEPRPQGPTAGKATPGRTVCWGERGETLRGPPPSPPPSSGERRRRSQIQRWGARRWPTGWTWTCGEKPSAGPAKMRRRESRG